MSKHTKGSWLKMPGNKAPIICVDGDKDWPIVTQVCGPDAEQIEANIRLITAAPEMFVALVSAFHFIRDGEEESKDHAWNKEATLERIKLAVAKAEGK